MKIFVWPILLLILVDSCNYSSDKGFPPSLTNQIRQQLDSLTRHHGIPGATFALRTSEGRTLELSSGYADREMETPMPADAVMFSGSVGKTVVAAIVLLLEEKGLVGLTDRVSVYLGDQPWYRDVPNAGDITIEMLLNHTAGVPEYVYYQEIWEKIRQNPDHVWSPGERLAVIRGLPPSNKPGEGWSYADSHYILLGCIIEKATGKRLESVVQEMIINPCKLHQTIPADKRNIPGLVSGYTSLSGELMLPEKITTGGRYAFNPQLEWTGGGLVTTVSDLTLWAQQLYGGKVLSAGSLERMTTPVTFTSELPFGAKYGLGCFTGGAGDSLWHGHTGFVPGYITILQYYPVQGIAMALQVNSDTLHGSEAKRTFQALSKDILLNLKPHTP